MGNKTISTVAVLLYLAFVSAAAYSLWSVLLKYNPVSKIAVFGFMNPMCGVIISGIVLKESGAFGIKGLISLIPWKKYGMEVAGDVANGALALQFIETHPVDLAVVDLTMPVLSGLEFICECRARGISMDYIVLSAHEDFTYVQKALRLGVLDYISKLQLEPEECGEVFLRAAEHIRRRKEI